MTSRGKPQRYWTPIVNTWNRLQLEANGAYSVERLDRLHNYSMRTTSSRCVLVLVVTPLPCLLLTVLIESIPLHSPADGIEYSFLVWVRTFALTVIVVIGFMWPCRSVVPGLPLSITPIFVAATASAVAGAAGTFGLAHAIGFPLPFTLVCESGIGMFIMGVGMVAAWGRFLYIDRNGRRAFIRQFALMGMQASMVWVYPAYAYVFNQLSAGRQVAAMAFLPAIKIFYKNMFARMLREHPDLKACIVVFSADLYHVLFLSWCMNGSTSKTAVVSLMLADVLESIVVLHEIDRRVVGISSDFTSGPRRISLLNRAISAVGLARARSKLKQGANPKIDVQVAHSRSKLWGAKQNCIVPLVEVGAPVQVNRFYHVKAVSSTTADTHLLASPSSLVAVPVAARQVSLASEPGVDKAKSLKLLHNSLCLLYTTEFVLLVEFTEVMVPCVYSLYLLAAFHMPNRAFLSNLRDKSLEELSSNIIALLGYSSLEFLSLITLAVIFQRRTRISILRQLAFALETNWLLAQANICLWVILAVQSPLEHYGVDFSFRFEWLRHSNK